MEKLLKIKQLLLFVLVCMTAVTVSAQTPVKLEISGDLAKTEYALWDWVDATGLTITLSYDDGTSRQVVLDEEWMVEHWEDFFEEFFNNFWIDSNWEEMGHMGHMGENIPVEMIAGYRYSYDPETYEEKWLEATATYYVTINKARVWDEGWWDYGRVEFYDGERLIEEYENNCVYPGTLITAIIHTVPHYHVSELAVKKYMGWDEESEEDIYEDLEFTQVNDSTIQFVMPEAEVEVWPEYEEDAKCTYTWRISGTESVVTEGYAGELIETPANPKKYNGKVFCGWTTDPFHVTPNQEPDLVDFSTFTTTEDTEFTAVYATKTVVGIDGYQKVTEFEYPKYESPEDWDEQVAEFFEKYTSGTNLLVYEKSDTEAYVFNGIEEGQPNWVEAPITMVKGQHRILNAPAHAAVIKMDKFYPDNDLPNFVFKFNKNGKDYWLKDDSEWLIHNEGTEDEWWEVKCNGLKVVDYFIPFDEENEESWNYQFALYEIEEADDVIGADNWGNILRFRTDEEPRGFCLTQEEEMFIPDPDDPSEGELIWYIPNEPVYLYKEVEKAVYSDFTTGSVMSLREYFLRPGDEGGFISGNGLQVAAAFTTKEGCNYLVVKDEDESVRFFTYPREDDHSYFIAGSKRAQEKYPQNNWVLVELGDEDVQPYLGKYLQYIKVDYGGYHNMAPLTDASIVVGDDVPKPYEPNVYCPVNFPTVLSYWSNYYGDYTRMSSVPAGEGEYYGQNFFFMIPKPYEYATITGAVYDRESGLFCVPMHDENEGMNKYNFHGAFYPLWDYNLAGDVSEQLRSDGGYTFHAIIILQYAPASPRHGVSPDPSKKAWEFFAAPVDLIDPHIVTDVTDVNAKKQVKSISYFNLMGVESAEPVDGVNIMVTTFTDGTTSSEKILK
ncbi:hypothetical protein [Sodaliphilus sp.]|uniref:hypothetical protein n=1 Tax=Sodaliphilus sp. TaxID=2815818 RepID=UPI0038910679